MTAIFDVGDELPFASSSFGIGAEWSAIRVVHWYLMREPDVARRGQILKAAAQNTTGLFLPVFKTSIESGKKERQKDPTGFAVAAEDLVELQQICVEKIRAAAASGALHAHPKIAAILFRWREWAGEEESKAWVESLASTPAGALRFLVGIAGIVTSHGMEDRVASTSWQVRISDLEAFIRPEALVEQLQQVDASALSETERDVHRAFGRAMERRAAGKGDSGPLDMEDDE